jgi:hypothetical protein
MVDGNQLPLVIHGLSEAQVAASVRFLRRVIDGCVVAGQGSSPVPADGAC